MHRPHLHLKPGEQVAGRRMTTASPYFNLFETGNSAPEGAWSGTLNGQPPSNVVYHAEPFATPPDDERAG